MINDVLDLAIPDREVYSGTSHTRDQKAYGKRKFRKFCENDGEYKEPEKKYHQAKIWRSGDNFPGEGPAQDHITITCGCGGFTKTGDGMEVFREYEEHAKAPAKTEVPKDDFYCEELEAHLVTSYVDTIDGVRYHAPAIDIDFPVHVRESSPGKSHVFIDVLIPEDKYLQLLWDMSKAEGLVEPGYASASCNFHGSSIRMPDITKTGDSSSVVVAKRKEKLENPLEGLRDLVEGMANGS